MLYSWTAGGIRVDNGVHLPSGNLRPSSPSLKTKKNPKRKQIALDNTTNEIGSSSCIYGPLHDTQDENTSQAGSINFGV